MHDMERGTTNHNDKEEKWMHDMERGTTDHDDKEQQWMHDMEREFIDWQRTHCCADCLDGIEDPAKLVDHFYETKPDPLDTKRNPVCIN